MAAEAITLLTQLSVLLLLGVIGSALAKKIHVSPILFHILIGLTIGITTTNFVFNTTLTVALGITALALVVFEGTSRFTLKQLENYSLPALELSGNVLLFTTILAGITSYALLFQHIDGGILFSLVLAFALSGTDPSSVLLLLPKNTMQSIKLLTLESVLNTPIVVLLPFIALDLLTSTLSTEHLLSVLQQLFVGVGAGIVIGLILFTLMRKTYTKDLSAVGIVTGALMTYILAENLEGSGVLAVATLGVIFGNVQIKEKEKLADFSNALGNTLEILVFILIGIMVGTTNPPTLTILLQSFLIFLSLLAARYIAAHLTLKKDYEHHERIAITLMMPKGIALAVLVFILASPLYNVPQTLLSTLFYVLVYSLITATVTAKTLLK